MIAFAHDPERCIRLGEAHNIVAEACNATAEHLIETARFVRANVGHDFAEPLIETARQLVDMAEVALAQSADLAGKAGQCLRWAA